MTTPIIIEAALNGATPRHVNARVPRSEDEIVRDGTACIDAGASIVHHHHDDAVLGGPQEHAAEPYERVWRRLRAHDPNALFYPTMAGGGAGTTIEKRYAHIEKLAQSGLLDLGLVDPGTTNIGRFYADGTPRPDTWVYQNTYADAVYMIETCRRLRIGMSISIFEPGFVRVIAGYLRAQRLPAGAMVKFYFGGADAGFGLPPTPTALDAYLEMLAEWRLPWMVSIQGGDLIAAADFVRHAIERGGHLQVGLEPNPHATQTNPELVRAAVDLARHLGRRAVDCAEARTILDLPSAVVRRSTALPSHAN